MKTKKKLDKQFRSPPVGFSLARTTSDNGCGIHQDRRTKRNRTRSQQRQNALRDQ